MKVAVAILLFASTLASAEPVRVVDCRRSLEYLAALQRAMDQTPRPSIFNVLKTRMSVETQQKLYDQRVSDYKTRLWTIRTSCPDS